MKRWFYSSLGFALGLLVRLYLATLRLELVVDPELDPDDPRPWVLCFWHGEQFPLLAWKRRRPTVALVSHSLDGQMQAQALRRQGLFVERGSSSRGGAKGLHLVLRRLSNGHDAAFAIDGPRGPRFSVAPGAVAAARLSGGILVPMGSAAASGVTLERAWDKFRIPLPFTRIAVHMGAPLGADASTVELACSVAAASELAQAKLRVVPSASDAVLRHARRA